MVNRRLVWFIEHNCLFAKEQSGFRQNRSTLDNIVSLESSILDAFLERKQLLAVFFDLQKAYDTAWRRGILDTLSSWGVGGNMLAFVDNFMRDRYFQVRLGNTLSDPAVLENGVPQGSVLSCTLFAVSINSIVSCVQRPVKCSLFVDDFAVYVPAKRTVTAERLLQMTIRHLEAWSRRTGFTFSTRKTQCIAFSRLRNIEEPSLTLQGEPIPVTKTIKFLGLTLDSRLTWIPHIKDLKAKCMKRLDVLRVLSGCVWGADRTCMLRLYRAYVRSCLDYGSQAYSSARPNALKMLDSVHHSGIRLATGAFRSSPIQSLLAESGEPPLTFRRKQLLCNYYFALKSEPNNAAYDIVFDTTLHGTYFNRPSVTTPFGVRAISTLGDFNIEQHPMRQVHQCEYPPWAMFHPKVSTRLMLHSKRNTPEVLFGQAFYEELCSLNPCDVIYTDGSKDESGTSCAFVTSSDEYKFCLPPASSVYTAELTAIERALNIFCPRTGRLVICSDSLSSLQAIQDIYSKHILVREIHSAVHSMSSRGTEVIFIWVPGHVGIRGNELADKAAKDALNLPPFTSRVLSTDLKCVIKHCTKSEWSNLWQETINNKLRVIKDSIKPWETSSRASRREEVVLCRLRIGHTRLTHGFLMARAEPPICAGCDEPLSVEHVLTACQLYTQERSRFRLPLQLQEVLGDENEVVERLFAFLEATSLLPRM